MTQDDRGDFQTPPELVRLVLATLARRNRSWTRMLEPTCGAGNFIAGCLSEARWDMEIQGIEVQPGYVEQATVLGAGAANSTVTIHTADIFLVRLDRDLCWRRTGPLLVVGNPPWVTNAQLGRQSSANRPTRSNVKQLAGLAAMTGASNFDSAEAIWLQLIHELAAEQPTIALLCKTAVARQVLAFCAQTKAPIQRATIHPIDARRWFRAAVDACLFTLDLGQGDACYEAAVYPDLQSTTPSGLWTVRHGQVVAHTGHIPDSRSFDGVSPLVWRQGIKHDAARIVELTMDTVGTLTNKAQEAVDVEPAYVFPLLKSSDLGGKRKTTIQRRIIVPQRAFGHETAGLRFAAPHLWDYLQAHADDFLRRKSSIYRRQPPFAYFGLGAYTFAPFKVAISGLYKSTRFHAVSPRNGRPVIFDDTCYLLPCETAWEAALLTAMLNDPLCQAFLQRIIFWDAKRPITKRVLQRIDLRALYDTLDWPALVRQAATVADHLGADQLCPLAAKPPTFDAAMAALAPSVPVAVQPALFAD